MPEPLQVPEGASDNLRNAVEVINVLLESGRNEVNQGSIEGIRTKGGVITIYVEGSDLYTLGQIAIQLVARRLTFSVDGNQMTLIP